MARGYRYSWGDPALGTVSLVHEAYLKLVRQSRVDWQSRAQFFCLASRAMRSILVDNARHHRRLKRGGRLEPVPMEDVELVSAARSDELLALDQALERLRDEDRRCAEIVDCRVFGGLTVDETADALGISPATVKRSWTAARSWLYRQLRTELEEPAT